MASLRTMVGLYKDELREGIAWVAFWREGRSWEASAFWLVTNGVKYPDKHPTQRVEV